MSTVQGGGSRRREPEDEAAPAPGARRSLVEAQILDVATELFAARGFAGTSLQDVARAAGLTRPALYHYFSSKDELLARLVGEVTVAPAAEFRRIRHRRDRPALERLRSMAVYNILQQARHPAHFRTMILSEADLPADMAETYAAARRDVLREFVAVIREGIDAGQIRPVDPRVAALGIIGACNWVAWWHKPGNDGEDERVAEVLSEMLVAGVAADGRDDGGDGMTQALARLHRAVADLDTVVAQRDPSSG